MMKRSLVAVIDDDESVRESLPDLLSELGYASCTFESAEDFLASDCFETANCLLLDIAMPGMTGPQLQLELARLCRNIPIVFISASTNSTLRPRLLARGAAACLSKPFSDTALISALREALAA